MTRSRTNFISGTLSANLGGTVGDTTLQSAGLVSLPVISLPDYAVIVLDPLASAGNPEIIYVTAHTVAATSATIQRQRESTTVRAHTINVRWVHAATVADWSHADLSGLTADDHTQYLRTDGTRASTGAQTFRAQVTITLPNALVTGFIKAPVALTLRLRSSLGANRVTVSTLGVTFFLGTTPTQPRGLSDVLDALVRQGLRATSRNPPLNLGTGAVTGGVATFSPAASGLTTLTVNPGAGHTGALAAFQVNGANMAYWTADGGMHLSGANHVVGDINATAIDAGHKTTFTTDNTGHVPLGVKGKAGQAANLTDWLVNATAVATLLANGTIKSVAQLSSFGVGALGGAGTYVAIGDFGDSLSAYFKAAGSGANVAAIVQSKGTGETQLQVGGVTTPFRAGGLVGRPKCGFFEQAPQAKATVTGSRGGNAALQSLLNALNSYGLVTDSST